MRRAYDARCAGMRRAQIIAVARRGAPAERQLRGTLPAAPLQRCSEHIATQRS